MGLLNKAIEMASDISLLYGNVLVYILNTTKMVYLVKQPIECLQDKWLHKDILGIKHNLQIVC